MASLVDHKKEENNPSINVFFSHSSNGSGTELEGERHGHASKRKNVAEINALTLNCLRNEQASLFEPLPHPPPVSPVTQECAMVCVV